MSKKILSESIRLKQYISERDYKEISDLEKICCSQDKTNLKLDLDYRLNTRRSSEMGLKHINEFLYYVDDILVAYLSISSYGGSNIGELNGMTHPDFRRKGIFKKLFELAIDECSKRKFDEILLLSDGNSKLGVGFINFTKAEYDFSEYRMKKLNEIALKSANSISLRKVGKLDEKEIARQNAIFFGHSEEFECLLEEDEKLNTYMVELKGMVIGKIKVDYNDNSAFICGFGILPDFRGKGYGKATLIEALRLINERNIHDVELDVECKNNTALNLYKACGFKEQSVMNYYKYNI